MCQLKAPDYLKIGGICSMTLMNQPGVHKMFGKGTVTAHHGDYITVKFEKEEKKFVVPDAFIVFLKCTNESLQGELEVAFAEKEEAKKQQMREAQEKALRKAQDARAFF